MDSELYKKLEKFIEVNLKKWDEIKLSYKNDEAMSVFLKRAYPVICFDYIQLDLKLALSLYEPVKYLDPSSPSREEVEKEKFRKKMVNYFENNLNEVSFEIRFASLQIDFIENLKSHPELRTLSQTGRASINVILKRTRLKIKE